MYGRVGRSAELTLTCDRNQKLLKDEIKEKE